MAMSAASRLQFPCWPSMSTPAPCQGEKTVAEAYIIDAVRTPRSIGKMGKGALSTMHPEHLSATVMAALKERNNLDTGDVDDVIWGVSGGLGLQAGDIGRSAALDAGFDVKAGGVTLNRFC